MRRSLQLALALAAALAACDDTTKPPERVLIGIQDIRVPTTLAPLDTAHISFRYEASCGEREVVLRYGPGRLDVAAYAFPPPPNLVCPAVIWYADRRIAIPPSERTLTYTVTFAQPEGPDSVRTIGTTLPTAR